MYITLCAVDLHKQMKTLECYLLIYIYFFLHAYDIVQVLLFLVLVCGNVGKYIKKDNL